MKQEHSVSQSMDVRKDEGQGPFRWNRGLEGEKGMASRGYSG